MSRNIKENSKPVYSQAINVSNSKGDTDKALAKTDEAMNKMIKISLICFLFLIAELVGGIIANSLAILTDAAHLTSDLSGFVISIIAIYIGRKKPNQKYTFGYYRAEVLGALVSVVTIWILTFLLIKEAIDRFFNPIEIHAPVMLLTALVGLVCNLAMMKVLHGGGVHGHSCSHNHSHLDELDDLGNVALEIEEHNNCSGHTHLETSSHEDSFRIDHEEPNHNHQHDKCNHSHEEHSTHNHSHEKTQITHHHEEENVNIRAALIHIIGDIIQSVGVVIASLIIYFKPQYIVVDPICTFVFSIIVIFTTVNITRQCLKILMEGSPDKLNIENIKRMLKEKVIFSNFSLK